jgi:peptidoglycan/LPS O-acetylase OafA/YrhL
MRKDIQVLRAFAVIFVILFHAFPNIFPGGYLGVDIFFAISGFVVTPLILEIFREKNEVKIRLKNFYKKRYYRLGPSLGFTIIFSIVLVFIFGNIKDHKLLYNQALASLLIAGNYSAPTLSGNYFNPRPNPLIHTWSLSAEVQLYLFIPLIFALLLKLFRISLNLKTFLVILFTICLVSLTSLLYLTSEQYFFSPTFRIIEFAVGSVSYLVSIFSLKFVKRTTKFNYFMFFVSSLFLLLLFINSNSNSILLGIFISCITAFILRFRYLDSLPKQVTAMLSWVGDRSYSIYLVHMPIIYIVHHSPLVEFQPKSMKIILSLVGVILSFAVGAFLYTKVENRYRIRSNTNEHSNIFRVSFSKVFCTSTLIPILFSIMFSVALSKQYFNFADAKVPVAAKDIIRVNCASSDKIFNEFCYLKVPNAIGAVLLIGDSHAEHFSSAVFNVAAKNRLDFVILNDPDSDVIDFSLINKFNKKYDKLLLVYSRWWNKNFRSDYEKNIVSLQQISSSLLVIGQTPVFPDQTLFFNSRSIFTSKYKSPKFYLTNEMNQDNFAAGDELIEFLRDNGISFLDPKQFFCSPISCTRWINDKWLYFDDNHLSIEGANLAIPQFDLFFKKFLGKD